MPIITKVRNVDETENVYGSKIPERDVYVAELYSEIDEPDLEHLNFELFVTDYDEGFSKDIAHVFGFRTSQDLGSTDQQNTFLHSITQNYNLPDDFSVFVGVKDEYGSKNFPTNLERAEKDDNGVPENCYLFNIEYDGGDIGWWDRDGEIFVRMETENYDRETYREVFDAVDGEELGSESIDETLSRLEQAFKEDHGINL